MLLHQYEISPFCDKVRRVLHVKGLDYDVREVSLLETVVAGTKHNPTGKVPYLEHDGQWIADSTNIVAYLEGLVPDPSLTPSTPRGRALAHVLEDWADESLYFMEVFLRFVLPSNAKKWTRVVAANDPLPIRLSAPLVVPAKLKIQLAQQGLGKKSKAQILSDLDRHLRALDGMLDGHDWLVEDRLTIADISVYAQMHCISVTPEGEAAIKKTHHVAAWMARVNQATARP